MIRQTKRLKGIFRVGNTAVRARRYHGVRAAVLPAEEVRLKVAERAYSLYQERGCVDGHDREDWSAAESQIKKELGL